MSWTSEKHAAWKTLVEVRSSRSPCLDGMAEALKEIERLRAFLPSGGLHQLLELETALEKAQQECHMLREEIDDLRGSREENLGLRHEVARAVAKNISLRKEIEGLHAKQ